MTDCRSSKILILDENVGEEAAEAPETEADGTEAVKTEAAEENEYEGQGDKEEGGDEERKTEDFEHKEEPAFENDVKNEGIDVPNDAPAVDDDAKSNRSDDDQEYFDAMDTEELVSWLLSEAGKIEKETDKEMTEREKEIIETGIEMIEKRKW